MAEAEPNDPAGCAGPLTSLSGQHRPTIRAFHQQLLCAKGQTEPTLPLVIIHAAWVLVVGRVMNSKDVVLDVAMVEDSSIADQGELDLPVIEANPVRFQIHLGQTIQEYLDDTKAQVSDGRGFQLGESESMLDLSLIQYQGYKFRTLLIIQSQEADNKTPRAQDGGQDQRLAAYGLLLHACLQADHVTLSTSFMSDVVSEQVAQTLLGRLHYVIAQLDQAKPDMLLSKIEMATPDALEQIWGRSSAVTTSMERCVHATTKDGVQAQPDSPAICAWDGELTAAEGPRELLNLEMEKRMQHIWARVLNIDSKTIGLGDNFFLLGGDSLSAMKLIREARESGIKLTVEDIFSHPDVRSLSRQCHAILDDFVEETRPFSLLGDGNDVASFFQEVSDNHQLNPNDIRDAYPCTPLQEGLMSQTLERPGAYMMQCALELSPVVNVDQFRIAWDAVSHAMPILRTRIVQLNDLSLVQVVLDEPINWINVAALDKYKEADRKRSMGLGQPLTRYAIVSDEEGTPMWFIWTVHHALFDGYSMSLITEAVWRAYQGQAINKGPSFSSFIKYIKDQDYEAVLTYWKEALKDCECIPFPTPLPSHELSANSSVLEYCFPYPNGRLNITTSNLIRAAWALVAGHMTSSDDVLFGATVFGRNAPVIGIDRLTGPTIATIPVRVQINKDQTVREYLESIQQQAMAMIPFEQAGLQRIAQSCPEGELACKFQSHITIQQRYKSNHEDLLGKWQYSQQKHRFSTSALTLELFLEDDKITASAAFDSRVIQPWIVKTLLQRLDFILQQLSHADNHNQKLADIKAMTQHDLDKIWSWNKTVLLPAEQSIYQIFAGHVKAQPYAPAICAWDGELTYNRLDQLSTMLAGRLIGLGVKPDTSVLLCFEKSMWVAVAILGVLKAGGSFILLEPSLPRQRLSTIAQQVKGCLVLCSPLTQDISSQLAPGFLTINWDLFTNLDRQSSVHFHEPSPSSVLYTLFTSGSTGTPKGVMITYSNVATAFLCRVRHLGLTSELRLYDFASYSFDVSICNIFTALAAGGCLCIPSDDDRRNNLAQTIQSLRANVLDVTPSLAHLLSPADIPGIQMLVFGGEALHIPDLKRWWGKTRIVHEYGPSECTPTSTINCDASSLEEAVTIGKGLGLVTWIVDPGNHDELLPLGCIGELLLEGPLVGRGYLNDDEKTAAAFIEDPIWLLKGAPGRPGRHGRLYKTGDLVQYNEDGSLTFIGRKDSQIKIRGQRIELGEIEHVLRNNDYVDNAAAILQCTNGRNNHIIGFVTVCNDYVTSYVPQENSEMHKVESWGEQFDSETYISIADIQPELTGRDFIGWATIYNSVDIDKEDMNEWLDDTIDTILNGGHPGEILEIGTGSGMILFNVTKGLQSYIGLEPSARAVDFVARTAKSNPALADKVKMFKASALDLNHLSIDISPSLAIANSVIQYFPSQAYLFKVVQELIKIDSMTRLFFGDVRSYALHQDFLATETLKIAGKCPTRDDARRIMADIERAETELLIDPAFFTALAARFPDQIEHIEILPKRMHATNELSRYRYAAVVHLRARGQSQKLIREINPAEWIDFVAQGLNRQVLLQILQGHAGSSAIAVGNIPYSKTILERHIIESINNPNDDVLNEREWLSSIRHKSQTVPSLSPIDLVELAKQEGYRVELSWARQYSQRGGFDAIFHRHEPVHGENRVLFRFPSDYEGRSSYSFSSQPLQHELQLKIKEQLREVLQANLPSYMVPQEIMILDKIPLNVNGKVDRRTLTKMAQNQLAQEGPKRRPTSEIEQYMQTIWSQVLEIKTENIGLDDSFFLLGGNSITAMKVVAEALKVSINLSVADIFRHPVLHDLASCTGNVTEKTDTREQIEPFELLRDKVDISSFLQSVSSYYQLDPATVRDAYPCTPLQEGLISLTSKRPGDYITQVVLEFLPSVNVNDLRLAWEQISRAMPILRTRLVQHSEIGLMQVVLDEHIRWINAANLDAYLEADNTQSMDLGVPLTRYALVQDDTGTQRWLVWTIHHSLFDGWSMNLLLEAVYRAFMGEQVNGGPQFQSFIQYIENQGTESVQDYWRNSLANYDHLPFPILPPSVNQPVLDKEIRFEITQHRRFEGITTPNLIRAAWALVAGHMASTKDVVFGAIVSGRNAPVAGIEAIAAPTFATVPVRVKLASTQRATDYLEMVQQQAVDMIPFEQAGLHRIANISPDSQKASAFQTLLVIQPKEASVMPDSSYNSLGTWRHHGQLALNTYALILEVHLGQGHVTIEARFDTRVLEPSVVNRLLKRLDFVMRQLDNARGTQKLLRDVTMVAPDDLEQIWGWNGTVPMPIEKCAHEMVAEQTRTRPTAPAVCAWDGELTYQELDQLSTRLVDRLIHLGVKPDTLVPLCFEKSMWTIVAVLGVLKAGGGFVLLEPSFPEHRLQTIIQQLNPPFILSSTSKLSLSSRLLEKVVELGPGSIEGFESSQIQVRVSPAAAMFAIFTSGSTGTPKGVVQEHMSYCSALEYQSDLFGFRSHSRVFDFASYAFDGSVHNIFSTLVTGGCLCIPSEKDRLGNLGKSIAAVGATLVTLTPTVARLIDPTDVPQLQTLLLVGEAVSINDVTRWWGKVQIINSYGPAECNPSTLNSKQSAPEEALHIGKGLGLVTWIVDPEDHDSLMPPGCTGELLLEGPLVGRGYLNDAEKTAASFIHDPVWLLQGSPSRPGRHGRLYKTGDLVRYDEDGNLIFVSRKDTQIKISGQRVELGEVESAVLKCIPEARQAVVEIILPQGENSDPALAAFIRVDRIPEAAKQALDSPDIYILPNAMEVKRQLALYLPKYMMPEIFLFCLQLPMTATGKINRRGIREMGNSLSWAAIEQSSEVLGSLVAASGGPILSTEQPAYELAQIIFKMIPSWHQCSLASKKYETAFDNVLLLHSGLDSLNMMTLLSFIMQHFDVNIGMQLLLDPSTSVRSLAQSISDLQLVSSG